MRCKLLLLSTLILCSSSVFADGEFSFYNPPFNMIKPSQLKSCSFIYNVSTSYSPSAVEAKISKTHKGKSSLKIKSINGRKLFFCLPSEREGLIKTEEMNIIKSVEDLYRLIGNYSDSKDYNVSVDCDSNGFPIKIYISSKKKQIGAPFMNITLSKVKYSLL